MSPHPSSTTPRAAIVACVVGLFAIAALAWGWTVAFHWHWDEHQEALDNAAYAAAWRPSETAQIDRAAAEESLRYYLDTHSVQDEGYDMMATLATRLLSGKPDTVGQGTAHRGWCIAYSDSLSHTPDGRTLWGWMSGYRIRLRRKGWGSVADTAGRAITGYWRADTIVGGTRTDSLGTYTGQMRRGAIAEGHGRWAGRDGKYYEGRWQGDMRDGFGMQLHGEQMNVGLWTNDRFKGEKMAYTSERIYGIDVSRYQHETTKTVRTRIRYRRGGRTRYRYRNVRRTVRFPLHWNDLRITRLGPGTGAVDFPVSFVYIKSTEGTSVLNKYYAADCRAARANGLRTGAYHFFSTKSGGAAQAAFFIAHSSFRQGDFPPVLDVEPTNAQVAAMGGPARLHSAIMAWMKAVERHTGTKPILYVGQSFVKKYVSQWPDIRRFYHIWIARYGEYRPDVRLAIWQLTPYGRVRGIQGDVDINVFNGYQDTWHKFVKQSTIKH